VTARVALRLLVLVGLAVVPIAVATGLGDPVPPLSITVDGQPAAVESGTRLRTVVRGFELHATNGRLLDVDGHVLDPAADPGVILLDGRLVPRRTVLHDGDVVTVVDGVDRTESTVRTVRRPPGRGYGDPQYSLSTAHIEVIRTVGRVSGIVVSAAYRPIGRIRTPRQVALTFDDGPWPGTTRAILRVLRHRHVPATFFVIGYLAKRYPALVRDEIRAGMTIGSHSWDHPEPFDAVRPPRMRAEMLDVNTFLKQRFGLPVSLFRPPGGSSATSVVTIASTLGLRVVDWNVDPRDWAARSTARRITRAVLSQVKAGSIVDLHDGGGDQWATVRALPGIIRALRHRGYTLVALR
jgi:peptidoglycan-N-acetylglucosamine deacetylase